MMPLREMRARVRVLPRAGRAFVAARDTAEDDERAR